MGHLGVRTTATEIAYESIRSAIIHGRHKPGERVQIEVWENEIGVSRTPIREAVRKLQAEGLIEQNASGYLFVKAISVSEIQNLYAVRIRLEELAVEEAISNMSQSHVAQLQRLAYQMEVVSNGVAVADVGTEFHQLIYDMSNNPINCSILYSLQAQIDRYRYLTVNTDASRGLAAQKEHQQILQAILDRDVDRATERIRFHVLNSRKSALDAAKGVIDTYQV